MVYNLTEDLCYAVDKGMYEQKMAIENMGFILSKHFYDDNDDFLQSELFERLHDRLVEKTASRWYRENEIIKQFTDGMVGYYAFDIKKGILSLEMK